MARLSDLHLDDSGPPARDTLAETRRAADQFLDTLRSMEDDARYEFCWGMIVDMRLTVEKIGRVTEGQQQAIRNVQEGVERHDAQKERWERHERRTGRRYEGFEGRNR